VQNDDDLKWDVAANETWMFDMLVFVNGPTNADFKCGFVIPSGTIKFTGTGKTLSDGSNDSEEGAWGTASSTATSIGSLAASNLLSFGTKTSANGGTYVRVRGIIRVGGTGGTVQFVWAQNTSQGTAISVESDSFIQTSKF
jgi:hypothetical protein